MDNLNAELLRSYGVYYTDALLKKLYDRPHPLVEVLTRKDGSWRYISNSDRVWTACHHLARSPTQRQIFLEFLARTAARVMTARKVTSQTGRDVIEAIRNDRVTSEIRVAAAALSPAATHAADSTTKAAAAASLADVAAQAAAYNNPHERRLQVIDLLELLTTP